MKKTVFLLLAALVTTSASTGAAVAAGKRHLARPAKVSRAQQRHERALLLEKYRAMRKVELERDLMAGRYAYLYKSPAWGVESLFFDGKHQLTVATGYSYATDCYDSSGSGSNSDITRLTFGEKPIQLQDILLASRLANRDYPAALAAAKATPNVGGASIGGPAPQAATDIFGVLAGVRGGAGGEPNTLGDNIATSANAVGVVPNDLFGNRNLGKPSVQDYIVETALDNVVLLGRAESYGVNISLARSVLGEAVLVGVDVPALYKKNTLRSDYDFSDPINLLRRSKAVAVGQVEGGSTDQFLERYGNNPDRYLKDVLAAKGISELGGSAAGLGDVALFVSSQFHSAYFDKLVAGLRIQMPTGKKQSMNKLWAPDLGNGGFTEISAFGNMLVSYKKFVNPHASVSAGFSLPGNVDRRVPKLITVTNSGAVPAMVNTLLAADQKLAFADRISLAGTGGVAGKNTFSAFDSLIPNFGDTVSSVRITRGAELKMRLGNMVEQFISRRAFLDLFYDFRAKMKDSASGLPGDQYDMESVRRHTNQLEHRLGFDYSYQFDLEARLRLGMRYTVAGRNVPKLFEAVGSVNYAF